MKNRYIALLAAVVGVAFLATSNVSEARRLRDNPNFGYTADSKKVRDVTLKKNKKPGALRVNKKSGKK